MLIQAKNHQTVVNGRCTDALSDTATLAITQALHTVRIVFFIWVDSSRQANGREGRVSSMLGRAVPGVCSVADIPERTAAAWPRCGAGPVEGLPRSQRRGATRVARKAWRGTQRVAWPAGDACLFRA